MRSNAQGFRPQTYDLQTHRLVGFNMRNLIILSFECSNSYLLSGLRSCKARCNLVGSSLSDLGFVPRSFLLVTGQCLCCSPASLWLQS